jgi:hypothetical protein
MATNCDITKGRILPCKDSVGGVHTIYYMNWDPTVTVTQDPETDAITDITEGDGTTGITLYMWDVKLATNLTETPTVSVENGTAFWEQVLTATFKKLDAVTRKELKIMTYGRMRAIIADNAGNALYIGKDFGIDVTGGSVVTGSNMEDLSGYTLIQTGREPEPALMLDGATLEDPFAGWTTPPLIIYEPEIP